MTNKEKLEKIVELMNEVVDDIFNEGPVYQDDLKEALKTIQDRLEVIEMNDVLVHPDDYE